MSEDSFLLLIKNKYIKQLKGSRAWLSIRGEKTSYPQLSADVSYRPPKNLVTTVITCGWPRRKRQKRLIVAGAFLFLAPLIFVPSLCGQRVASAVICMLHCLIVMLPFTSFHCWLICQLLFWLIVCSIKSKNSENHNLPTVTSCFQPTLPKGCPDYYHIRQRSTKKW